MMISLGRLNKERLAVNLLSLVFIASFVPYVIGITLERQLVAVGFLLFFGFIVLPLVFHQQIGLCLRSLLNPRVVLIALILPIIPTVVAISYGKWDAVGYALLMTGVLIACQISLAFISMRAILRSFASAGVVAVIMFYVSDASGILHSALYATRLIPPEMQPNALGFIFAGFIPVFVWRFADKSAGYISRGLFIIVAMADAVAIFLASSRASMLALGCALLWLGGLWGIRALRGRGRLVRSIFLLIALLVFAGGITAVLRPVTVEQGITYASKILQLNSSYRGINSGLSGRLERWDATLTAIAQNGKWAFGSGYRTSSDEMGFSVDNGYLVVVYEMGVFGLIVIMGQLLWCLAMSARSYIHSLDIVHRRYFMLLSAILVTFLVNNIFDRYLFGIGNPFSLIGLIFLLTGRKDLLRFVANIHN